MNRFLCIYVYNLVASDFRCKRVLKEHETARREFIFVARPDSPKPYRFRSPRGKTLQEATEAATRAKLHCGFRPNPRLFHIYIARDDFP